MNPSKALQLLPQAYALHQSGRLREAEPVYRKALRAASRDAVALYMFGLLNLQLGNGEEAVRWNDASLKINPNQPEALNNKGLALQNLGRNEEALAAYEQAVKLNPAYAGAWYNRGNALQDMKRYDEAISSYRQALTLRPNHADTWINLGKACKLQEHYEDACACYEKAVALAPGLAVVYNNLGNALMELKRYDEAQANFNKAIAFKPDYADAYLNLGLLLPKLKQYGKALTAFDKAIALAPDNVDAYLNRGFVLQEMERYEEALASHQKAVALKPGAANVNFHLGQVLQSLKRMDEALASYDRAIELDPDYADAYAGKSNLFMELGSMDEAGAVLEHALKALPNETSLLGARVALKALQADDPLFGQLEKRYAERASLPSLKRVMLDFAMGKSLEAQGKYDDAFKAYEEGNQLHYQENPYDLERDLQRLASTRSYFSTKLIAKCQAVLETLPAVEDERVPVFIVGMPRSGTTLTEQVLASHPDLFGAGELVTFGNLARTVELPPPDAPDWEAKILDLRRLGQKYMEQTWKLAPDARYITDKMPHNFNNLVLIHLMLPNAKILHVVRDPMDNCFSCYALRFQKGHEYCYDQEMLGRHYRIYQQYMQHWHSVLSPGRILDVRYEDTVADLEMQARRILEYVDLPWDPACLNFYETKRSVKTASITQVRQPIYKTSVARWKRFEKHLGPLKEILQADA